MDGPSWGEFVDRWAAERLGAERAAGALERLRRNETYLLAHREWAAGATDRDVVRLLELGAREIGAL